MFWRWNCVAGDLGRAACIVHQLRECIDLKCVEGKYAGGTTSWQAQEALRSSDIRRWNRKFASSTYTFVVYTGPPIFSDIFAWQGPPLGPRQTPEQIVNFMDGSCSKQKEEHLRRNSNEEYYLVHFSNRNFFSLRFRSRSHPNPSSVPRSLQVDIVGAGGDGQDDNSDLDEPENREPRHTRFDAVPGYATCCDHFHFYRIGRG